MHFGKEKPLTPVQLRAAKLIAEGQKQKQVAAQIGVSEKTMSQWRRKEAFERAVSKGVQAVLGDIAPEALERMARLMRTARSEHVQMLAARELLSRAGVTSQEGETDGIEVIVHYQVGYPDDD